MTNKVRVRIEGRHTVVMDVESDNVELITFGKYVKKGGKHYIKYDELDENSEKVVKNLLKISENEVELVSRGSKSSHMYFAKGKKNYSFYRTPFGEMNVAVDTYSMDFREEEDCLEITLEYGLEVNREHVSECAVKICIEAVEE